MNDEPEFELVWNKPREPDVHEHFDTWARAQIRISEIRHIFREYTLYRNGEAIDWGYSER